MENELDPKLIKEWAERGRQSLFFFARFILGFDRITKEIHRPLCKKLQNEANFRKGIILPRGWYKTTICSIAYPMWRAVNNPEIRILLVQNTHKNALAKLSNIKSIFENNALFRACYPEILPDSMCKWAGDSLQVKRKGSYPESTFECGGTSTQFISRHYDIIIEDDTVAPDYDAMTGVVAQPTQEEVEKALGFHKLCLGLLMEPAYSEMLVVGTRWVEGDLLDWIQENEKIYEFITRAAKEDEYGNPDKEGQLTWPERFPQAALEQMEQTLGPYLMSALYFNMPLSAADQVFKRDWIIRYQTLPDRNLVYCTSVDPAAGSDKANSDPDYNIVLTTAVDPSNGHVYIVHYDRGRFSPGELINVIFDHNRVFHPQVVKIESVAYQRTLSYWIEEKQRATNTYFSIEQVTHGHQSKEDRIRGLQPYFAYNRIFLKNGMAELENELLAFPIGKHDDIIDSLSMQMDFWNNSVEYEKQRYREFNSPVGHLSAGAMMQEIRDRYTSSYYKRFELGTSWLHDGYEKSREDAESIFETEYDI